MLQYLTFYYESYLIELLHYSILKDQSLLVVKSLLRQDRT